MASVATEETVPSVVTAPTVVTVVTVVTVETVETVANAEAEVAQEAVVVAAPVVVRLQLRLPPSETVSTPLFSNHSYLYFILFKQYYTLKMYTPEN